MKLKKEEEKMLMKKHLMKLMNDSRLNSWEKEFIKSIEKQIKTKNLTEKQLNIFNKIRKKYLH